MQDKDGLIGYTGLVGSNLMLQKSFNKTYNSRNISEIEGEKFDQLVCAGVSGTKFLANKYPEQDKNNILKLIENIKKIREVKKFILISTVDVYPNVSAGDETTDIENIGLNHYYGTHRADVEKFIKGYFDDYLIVRLPAIYGENLKKNFIFDMIYKIPYLIKKEVFIDLQKKVATIQKKKIEKYYRLGEDLNYILSMDILESREDIDEIKNILNKYGLYAEKFTDSRNSYQFYNLKNLWSDIQTAVENDIKILNITSYPLTAQEVAKNCFEEEFDNVISGAAIVNYNLRSIYSEIYGGENGYLYGKEKTINELKKYVNDKRK